MTRNPLVIDLGLALVAAVLILVLAPGLAVAGLIALAVLVVAAVSFVRQSRRRRARTVARTRPHPPRRR